MTKYNVYFYFMGKFLPSAFVSVMGKILITFFLLALLIPRELNAQCPIAIGISSVPDISSGALCKGTPIQLTADPSIGAITPSYLWIVDGDTIMGVDSVININANSQSIQLRMVTNNGCANDTAFVNTQVSTVQIQPTVTITRSSCDLTLADILITSSGGSSPYTYELVGQGTSTVGIYNDVPAGTYTLYISDNQGCNDTTQVDVTPTLTPLVPIITPVINECNQPTADVIITTSGGTSPYSYDLVGIGQNSDGNFTDVPTGSYTLYITDSEGCQDTNIVSIVPYTCPDPIPSEAITPNDDGFNDTWNITFIDLYPNNEVFIFDRWGQRVYHKSGYTNLDRWDAKYIGLDVPVTTYYYILKLEFEKSEDKVFKGAVSVFR